MRLVSTDPVALDTNQYVLGIRRSRQIPTCSALLFEYLPRLIVFLPLQIIIEMHRSLILLEQHAVYDLLATASDVIWDYAPPSREVVERYQSLGAKRGDAVIAAHLHAAGVRWLISENRHFLSEIRELPFKVITSAEAIHDLNSPGY